MIRQIIIFVSGAGVGVLGSMIFFKKRYEKIADEEIASVKEVYKRNSAKLDKALDELDAQFDEANKMAAEFRCATLSLKDRMNRGEKEPTNYGSYFGKDAENEAAESAGPGDEQLDENYYESLKLNALRGTKTRPPKIIKGEEYGSNPVYESAALYYYTDDGVLTNEEEEKIDDVERLIGDSLFKYGFADNEYETAITVRNYELGMDFEITKVFGSYESISR